MGRPDTARWVRPARLLTVVAVIAAGSWCVARSPDRDDVLRSATAAEAPARSLDRSPRRPARVVAQPGTAGIERPRAALSAAGTVTVAPSAPPTSVPAPTTTALATTAPPMPPPVVPRPVPPEQPAAPGASAGYVSTAVGCASGTSAAALDAFFRDRIGPVIGHDYQHVYDLGGGRHLWLFQDTFVDHGGAATRLDQAAFAHNTAMLQEGACFTLLHRGSSRSPTSFEPGTGERRLSRWFWPLGGESADGRLHVFWVEMAKTADPQVPDGLGWIPVRTWLATYRTTDLARIDFRPAPAPGVTPIYGYAVSSDDTHSYLFGNSFDQNLARQGGYWSCPCSATAMWLARVPRGRLDAAPEFWTGTGWSGRGSDAQPITTRFHAENPMQPRYLGGQWVAATKVDGYWGDDLAIDVARDPWGPWTTAVRRPLTPRNGDPLMNSYHAHLMPWLDAGALVVSVSQNARDMGRHAFPHPERYRLQFLPAELPGVPPPATTAPPTSPPPPPPPDTTTVTAPVTTGPPSTAPPPATEPTATPTSVAPSTAPPTVPPSTTDPCDTTTTSTTPASSSSTSSTTTTSPTSSTSSTTTTSEPCGP